MAHFGHPPLAEFDVVGARSFADYTMGVRGTAVRPRGVRWRSGAAGRPRGILKHSRKESFGHHHYLAVLIKKGTYRIDV